MGEEDKVYQEPKKDKQQTLGQFRVGLSFNPSNNKLVNEIKTKAADLIDLIERNKPIVTSDNLGALTPLGEEIIRLSILAQDQIESAAMWAVKAATKS